MSIPQYDIDQRLYLQAGERCHWDPFFNRSAKGPKAVRSMFQAVRERLSDAIGWRRVFVAWRQGRSDAWRLGTFRKDRLGRIRFYDGWPHHNGLTQLTDRRPFNR